jgi:hypothetical protein
VSLFKLQMYLSLAPSDARRRTAFQTTASEGTILAELTSRGRRDSSLLKLRRRAEQNKQPLRCDDALLFAINSSRSLRPMSTTVRRRLNIHILNVDPRRVAEAKTHNLKPYCTEPL